MSLEKAEYFLKKAGQVIERKSPKLAGKIGIEIDPDGKQGLGLSVPEGCEQTVNRISKLNYAVRCFIRLAFEEYRNMDFSVE